MANLPPTILVIDDEPANLQVVTEYLQTYEFDISIAQTGLAGLTRAKQLQPDLILLDIRLPDIDGFETCRRLKEDDQTKHIPVIFMTVLTSIEDKVKGFALGGVDYVSKPVQQEEFFARVQTHLTLGKLQNRLEQQVKERTAELAETNAQLKAEIVERGRIEAELKNRNRELALLNQVIATFTTDIEPETMLDIACREITEVFQISGVTAALLTLQSTHTVLPDLSQELLYEQLSI